MSPPSPPATCHPPPIPGYLYFYDFFYFPEGPYFCFSSCWHSFPSMSYGKLYSSFSLHYDSFPLFEEAGCAPALLLHNTEPPGQGVITTVSPLHSPNAQWESDKYFIHSWSKCLLTFTIQCARYYDKYLKHFSYPNRQDSLLSRSLNTFQINE